MALRIAIVAAFALSAAGASAQPADPVERVWSPADEGIRENQVTAVSANPNDPRDVLAATAQGAVYRTLDGGQSWQETLRVPFGAGTADGIFDDTEPGAGNFDDELSDEDLDLLEELRERIRQTFLDEFLEELGEEEAEIRADEAAEVAVEERRAELLDEARYEAEQAEQQDLELGRDEDTDVPRIRAAAVRRIVYDPTFPGLVYLATRDGVWRSGDGGSTWIQLSAGVGEEERDAIDIAPSSGNPDRIVIGTAAGALVSDDGGQTFSRASGELGSTEVRALAVDRDRRQVIAAGTANGVFVSNDGGTTFRKLSSGTGEAADVRAVAFVPGSERLVVGTAAGLWGMTAGSTVPLGVAQFSDPSIRDVVVPRADPSRVYVATPRGVFESVDGGEVFTELFRGMSTTNIFVISEEARSPLGLWAGTARGLYRLRPEREHEDGIRDIGPPMNELLWHADRYGRFDAETMASWRRQARWSYMLPRVSFRYQQDGTFDRQRDRTEILDLNGQVIGYRSIPTRYERDFSRGYLLMLTWQFDQIIGRTTARRLENQLRSIVRLRNQRLTSVVRLARERQELAVRIAAVPAEDLEERVRLELRLQELTSYLEAATGGEASRRSDTSQEDR